MAQDAILLKHVLEQDGAGIVQRWIESQFAAAGFRGDRISRAELAEQSRRFLALVREASASGASDIQSPAWANTRQMLEDLSASRAHQGFSPSETASFVFSLKDTLFDTMRQQAGRDAEGLSEAVRDVGTLLDKLGL